MPNPSKLMQLLSKLPAGSKEAQEAARLEAELREAIRAAQYAPHTPSTATGRSALSDIKDILGSQEFPIRKMATGGQAFPLQEEFQTEVERRAARPRTRAGVPVEDTNVLGGALRGLANTLGGLAFGRTVGTLGMPADILEPTAATGAMIPMFGMAGMPSEISKALVQQFAPKGPDIPAPTSEYLLEKGLEKFKPPQEFEVSAKLGRFMPFDIAEMQAAGRKLKTLQPTFMEMMESGLERATEPTRSYVIKPEGGNWLNKTIESYLQPLRWEGPHAPERFPGFNEEGKQQAIAVNNFVDKKLAKYMRNEMGTMSDPVRLQADQWAETKTKLLADKQKQIDKARADMEKARRERNVEPEVLTRSQARIRELEKEKALIENRTGLHYQPRETSIQARNYRRTKGKPTEPEAKTEVGKLWENMSDRVISEAPYREHIPLLENDIYATLQSKTPEEQAAVIRQMNQQSLESMGGKFAVENPEAIAYKADKGLPPYELGFDHLIDELQNAMDAGSGLPKELLISPKTLDKMSVPQAIEHVDKINAWRASQKAEADAARAANQATVLHKEYPEAGLKWVELKLVTPEQFDLPEGFRMIEDASRNQAGEIVKMGYRLESPEGKLVSYGETPAEAYAQHFGKKALEDALKYEGEMLKHCVGGYCPDVISGKSRIFSLRDEAGRPHATIEVGKSAQSNRRYYDLPEDIQDEVLGDALDSLRQIDDSTGEKIWNKAGDMTYYGDQKLQEIKDDLARKWFKNNPQNEPDRIVQIKGESNRAPSKEVEPYVQDFVKSGTWSDVGDLRNTGLFRVTKGQKLPGFSQEIPEGYYTLDDFKQMAIENEMPQEILDSWIGKLEQQGRYGYADGGAVHPAVEKFAASLPHPAVTEFENRVIDLGDMITGGGAIDLSTKVVGSYAMGGAAYNTIPDVSDAEKMVQGPAF